MSKWIIRKHCAAALREQILEDCEKEGATESVCCLPLQPFLLLPTPFVNLYAMADVCHAVDLQKTRELLQYESDLSSEEGKTCPGLSSAERPWPRRPTAFSVWLSRLQIM